MRWHSGVYTLNEYYFYWQGRELGATYCICLSTLPVALMMQKQWRVQPLALEWSLWLAWYLH